jgi:hypothetical protein
MILKGLLLRSYGRTSDYQPVRAYQTLKNKTIGNKAYRYRLEKISGTCFVSPALLRVMQNAGHCILSPLKKDPAGHQ